MKTLVSTIDLIFALSLDERFVNTHKMLARNDHWSRKEVFGLNITWDMFATSPLAIKCDAICYTCMASRQLPSGLGFSNVDRKNKKLFSFIY
jgi:hypothetical protein